ncbi:hypothetical protein OBBRIDRAFT_786425 [Obba rivulosa]|uniref:Uncharacterized protein n=1 Tax=Obba rivulosa TaxID=1052685 RepID=A0A8E2DIY9_9APHY|nr:hypothetical protein OBBRIDRAFT_786425 [Obba rivulosa]
MFCYSGLFLLACSSPVLSLSSQITLSKSLDVDNTTAPYVFNSLASLLTQWPNTYHPNGHTIIPGVLEPFTLLYHARKDARTAPSSPEWFAFDPEMSYGIMARVDGQTFMFTYQNIRPIKIVYFDGMSAALSNSSGWLDSQEILIRGKGRNGSEVFNPWDEYDRAESLCEWGNPFGVEGYVRMNAGFELLWCDFTSPSIQLVSHLNITPPGTPPGAPIGLPPPGKRPKGTPYHLPREPFTPSPLANVAHGDWLRAAAHRNSVPQPQIRLDFSAFVSFYHPRLRSLMGPREGQSMRQHRIWPDISDSDAESVVLEMQDVLRRVVTEPHGPGLNWGELANVIIGKWGDRIAQLHDFLDNSTSALRAGKDMNLTETLLSVQRLSYSPLNLYIDTTTAWPSWNPLPAGYPVTSHTPFWNASSLWRCTFSATWFLHGNVPYHQTSQEKLLQTSIETVQARLCSDYGAIFTESLEAKDSPERSVLLNSLEKWQARVVALMQWLDWTDWLRCDEVCPSNSICTMPLWPLNMAWQRPGAPEQGDTPTAWKPRCEKLDADRPPRRYRGYEYDHLDE